MTNTYPQRVRENILPLSVAGTLPEAFKEWYFTEQTEDHEQPVEQCQLCNQEELRYHFEIRNKLTKRVLWVGSQCILKFKLAVFEGARELDARAAKRKLDGLMAKMRLESCVKALETVAAKESNEILKNALKFYRTNKYLTPRFAFVVFWRLKANNIDHSPSFFKVSLKKDKYKRDLAQMEVDRVHVIWPALSSSQRQIAMKYGHTAPPDALKI